MTLINSLSDGMNFFLTLLFCLPASLSALFIFIVGMSIIGMLAKKVSGG